MNPYTSLFSRDYEDRFSQFFLACAESVTWACYGFASLIGVALLVLQPALVSGSCVVFAITWVISLSGCMGTWLSALAHSTYKGSMRLGWLILLVWPLSFIYTWRQLYVSRSLNKFKEFQ